MSLRGPADVHIDAALASIRHRGPDASGTYSSEGGDCHLGHVRLSILDLSMAGRQPMADASGRFFISYNGEVYNYLELRDALTQRHGAIAWRSGTDTEVILEGFAREGIPFFERMNGFFALAIYDAETRLLHVLRDPLGIKPLFIIEPTGSVCFCSEIKGLLALGDISCSLREQSLADQLAFMYVPEPYTLFSEVRKVEPGVCFTYRDGRQVEAKPLFSHLNDPLDYSTQQEVLDRLSTGIAEAVQRQLIADVPVSLFLSGGLDSSAVAYHAVRGGANIKDAYTIAFSPEDRKHDAQSDDLHYATFMARQLGLKLRVIKAEENFIDLLPKLMRFMEDGFTDPAAINTYLISAGAREDGVKVMLSGQGADEYLGGYRRYLAEGYLRRLPAPLRYAFRPLGRLLADGLHGRFNAASRRIARLADLASLPPAARVLAMYTWTTPDTISELFIASEPWRGDAAFGALLNAHTSNDIIGAMLRVDQYYDLRSLNLCYTDRMSMAVGMEVRVPFLDFDLVRLMNAIPAGLKVKGAQGKYVLKKAMEPLLPKKIIYRDKAGFGLPIRAWLRNNCEFVGDYLAEDRIRRQGILRPETVRRILDEQSKGAADHANTVFTLLCQQIWLEQNSGKG